MLKVALMGIAGRMGREILKALINNTQYKLTAAICRKESLYRTDPATLIGEKPLGIEITDNLNKVIELADVVIDFTTPETTVQVAKICKENSKHLVVGTTGFNQNQLEIIRHASKYIPILMSPNMSPGVNLLFSLAQKAAQSLDEQYDIEIIEKHHRNKLDAPSGTALKLGEVIAEAQDLDINQCAIFQRHGIEKNTRPYKAIGFSCVRGGDIIGEHTAMFAGPGEQIEITHKSSNRSHYASGALQAALWLHNNNKTFGMFSMQDVFT